MVKGGWKTEEKEITIAVEVFQCYAEWNARFGANIVNIYTNRCEMFMSVKGAKCRIRDIVLGRHGRQYFRPCGRRRRIRVQIVILYKYLCGFTYETVSDNSDSHFNNL